MTTTIEAVQADTADRKIAGGPDGEESAKRRQILDGARKVFLADGFDGASMSDIARTAGVSKGTLYVYFDSKVDLFEALTREERRQQAEQSCIIDDDGSDLRQLLVRFGVNLVEMVIRPSSLAQARTVLAVAAKFPQIGRAFYEAGPQVGLARMAAFLRRRIASGDLVIDDVDIAAAQLIDLVGACLIKRATFCVADRLARPDIERHVAKGVEVFLRAYGQTGRSL